MGKKKNKRGPKVNPASQQKNRAESEPCTSTNKSLSTAQEHSTKKSQSKQRGPSATTDNKMPKHAHFPLETIQESQHPKAQEHSTKKSQSKQGGPSGTTDNKMRKRAHFPMEIIQESQHPKKQEHPTFKKGSNTNPSTTQVAPRYSKIQKDEPQISKKVDFYEETYKKKRFSYYHSLQGKQESQSTKKQEYPTSVQKPQISWLITKWSTPTTTTVSWQLKPKLSLPCDNDFKPHILGNLPPYDRYSRIINIQLPFHTSKTTLPTNTNFQIPYKSYSNVVSAQPLHEKVFKNYATTKSDNSLLQLENVNSLLPLEKAIIRPPSRCPKTTSATGTTITISVADTTTTNLEAIYCQSNYNKTNTTTSTDIISSSDIKPPPYSNTSTNSAPPTYGFRSNSIIITTIGNPLPPYECAAHPNHTVPLYQVQPNNTNGLPYYMYPPPNKQCPTNFQMECRRPRPPSPPLRPPFPLLSPTQLPPNMQCPTNFQMECRRPRPPSPPIRPPLPRTQPLLNMQCPTNFQMECRRPRPPSPPLRPPLPLLPPTQPPPNMQCPTNFQMECRRPRPPSPPIRPPLPLLPRTQPLPPYNVTTDVPNIPGVNINPNDYQMNCVNCPPPAQYLNQHQFSTANRYPAAQPFSWPPEFQPNIVNTNTRMIRYPHQPPANSQLQQFCTNTDNQQPLLNQHTIYEPHSLFESQPSMRNNSNIPEQPKPCMSIQRANSICCHYGRLFPPVPLLDCCRTVYNSTCQNCKYCIEFIRGIISELNTYYNSLPGDLKWADPEVVDLDKSQITSIANILTNRMIMLSHVYARPKNGIQHQPWIFEIQLAIAQFLFDQENTGHTADHTFILFAILSARIGYLTISQRLSLSMFDTVTIDKHRQMQMSTDAGHPVQQQNYVPQNLNPSNHFQNYNPSMQPPANYNMNMNQPQNYNMNFNPPQNYNLNLGQPPNYNNIYVAPPTNYPPPLNQYFPPKSPSEYIYEHPSNNTIVKGIKKGIYLLETE